MIRHGMQVLVLVLLAVPLLGQSDVASPSTGRGRPSPASGISNDYAKAALLALKAIERDASLPKPSGDRILVNRHTQKAIDAADVAGTTHGEARMTAELNAVYLKKLLYNQQLESEAVLHEATDDDLVKLSAIIPDLAHERAMQRATQEPKMQAFSKELDACFYDFEKTLRARSAALPTACASSGKRKQ